MLISEDYKEQNKELHRGGSYGLRGAAYTGRVLELAAALKTRDILDYGCGQRTLEKSLAFPIKNYDPCIEGLEASPEPAELVVCTDVLEHIEPECLEDVLDDLHRVTKNCGLYVIATRPAQKTLPDGRNAHLIQESAEWWFPKLWKRFALVQVHNLATAAGGSIAFVAIVGNRREEVNGNV